MLVSKKTYNSMVMSVLFFGVLLPTPSLNPAPRSGATQPIFSLGHKYTRHLIIGATAVSILSLLTIAGATYYIMSGRLVDEVYDQVLSKLGFRSTMSRSFVRSAGQACNYLDDVAVKIRERLGFLTY